MPTRRNLLAGGVTGLSIGALPFTAEGRSVSEGPREPKASSPSPYLQPPRPISEVDFRAPEGISPSERSAAFVAKSAHLFEGLKPRFATKVIKSRFIPMRDGVRLSTDFHIPLGAALPLPVILIRTPYGKNGSTPPLCAVFPEQGFILAYQDVRGRHESEGVFVANAGSEREDGYDTLEWLAAQPWCNGKIGAWGSSYLGETAARLSAMRHPNHRCSVIMFDGSNCSGLYQNGAFTQGGVTMLSELFTWMRDAVPAVSYGPPPYIDREAWFAQPFAQNYATDPVKQPAVDLASHLRTLPVFDLLERSGAAPSEFAEMMRQCDNPRGAYFDKQEFLTSKDQFNVPALHVAGLVERGDSAFANFDLFRKNGVSQLARDNQYLMFAPTPHSGYMSGAEHMTWGARDLGDTRFPYLKTFVDWFGRWLRDDPSGVEFWPKVRHYVVGANQWRAGATWPPADARELRFYLRSDGAAATSRTSGRLLVQAPEGAEPADEFRYDPADPCPSAPPTSELDGLGDGYVDFRPLEDRSDVLVYTSDPMGEGIEFGGAVSLVLKVSSSAKDTDFSAVLLEVDDQGRAINITRGIARARYREGLDRKVWMSPGGIYTLAIDLWFVSIRIPKGHRLRLHISSSQFPFFDRNLNTGGDNYTETRWVAAQNQVHHTNLHASYLSLPRRTDVGGSLASRLNTRSAAA